MRTTVELSDRTHARLQAKAAERGMRDPSPLVEEAVKRMLSKDDKAPRTAPTGLASIAGALADWDDLDV
jgi:predicted transcriptional regulator